MTAAGVQHCPRCAAEYVAGVAVCADCGGPLVPGPLADGPAAPAVTGQQAVALPDVLLTTMPGLQADLVASSLTMEGVACLLECDGMTQLRQPGGDSPGALAATLPVDVYVGRLDLDRARDVIESIRQSELIGDQWQTPESRADPNRAVEDAAALASPPGARPSVSGGDGSALNPRAESTTWRLLFLVAAAVALVFAALRC